MWTVLVRVVSRDSKLGKHGIICDWAFCSFISKNLVTFSSMLHHPYLKSTLTHLKALIGLFLGSQGNGGLFCLHSALPSALSFLPMFPVLYQELLTLLILLRLQALPGENNEWGNQMNLQRRGVGFVLQMDWFSGPHTMNAISWCSCFLGHLSLVTRVLCALKSYRSQVGIQIVLLCESQGARSLEGISFLPCPPLPSSYFYFFKDISVYFGRCISLS